MSLMLDRDHGIFLDAVTNNTLEKKILFYQSGSLTCSIFEFTMQSNLTLMHRKTVECTRIYLASFLCINTTVISILNTSISWVLPPLLQRQMAALDFPQFYCTPPWINVMVSPKQLCTKWTETNIIQHFSNLCLYIQLVLNFSCMQGTVIKKWIILCI